MDETQEELSDDNEKVQLWPVLSTYERNPFDKDKVPPSGITVLIKEVARVETRYKKEDGTPRIKLLIRTDLGDIWAPWREVNKLKTWWGETTKAWEGKSMHVTTEKILVNNDFKKTLVFEKAP